MNPLTTDCASALAQDPFNLDMDVVAKTFADFLKLPMVKSAKIIDGSSHFLNVYSEWNFADVVTKNRSTYAKQYSLLKASLPQNTPVVAASGCIPCSSGKLSKFSSNGLSRAVLTESLDKTKSEGNGKGEFLHIYNSDNLVKTFDLKKLDKHQNVFTSAQWGSTLTWSQDGSKLAYLAEKKLPEALPFFPVNLTDSSKDVSRKGDEFAFRQSWGEQLTSHYEGVIVILDVADESFQVYELPDGIFPSDLQWVNNSSLIGTGYVATDWRLGLIYCSNRESRIFQIGVDGIDFRYLSKAGRAAMSPRVSPNSSLCIWQERDVNGPHQRSRDIMGVQLESKLQPPKILYGTNPHTKIPVYQNFPSSCWSSDGTKLYVVTPNDLESVLLEFQVSTDNRIIGDPAVTPGIDAVLSVGKDFLVASRSSVNESPALLLINIGTKRVIELGKSSRVVTRPVTRISLTGSMTPSSFYYGPAGDEVKIHSVPLVVMPHGGPHSIFSDSFVAEVALYLWLGFGVVRLNYVGSIGGTIDTTEMLCGNIGTVDVKDCQGIVETLLSQEPKLDPSKIVVNGGSHGGFIGAHLTSSYPDFYKAAALRNPTTDMLVKLSVSDITDWSYVEMGLENASTDFVPVVRSLEDAKKLMMCSPIQHVAKIKGATLLLLGSEDLRVPMSQGLAYYRALRAAGKTAEVRIYYDCHPLQKVPCRFDVMMQTVQWFSKYLR